VLSLRLLQPDSDSGIASAQLLAAVGAHSPKGIHTGVHTDQQRVDLQTDTESVYEVRAHYLRQFPGRSEEFSHQGELSSLAAVAV
jgi:hypothetical protein